MPSSGYGSVDLLATDDATEADARARRLKERACLAMGHGLFVEWMESFVAAWNETHDVDAASWAGIEEWDL